MAGLGGATRKKITFGDGSCAILSDQNRRYSYNMTRMESAEPRILLMVKKLISVVEAHQTGLPWFSVRRVKVVANGLLLNQHLRFKSLRMTPTVRSNVEIRPIHDSVSSVLASDDS